MSQWSTNERTFVGDNTIVRVLAHVKTNGFEPIASVDNVDYLILMDIQGNREEAERIFNELCARYVGHPYKDWLL